MNLKTLKNLDRDGILTLLGLEPKSSSAVWVAGALATFGVGLLAGAGLALMLAPKPGRELRGAIRERMRCCTETRAEPEPGPDGSESPSSTAAASHTPK